MFWCFSMLIYNDTEPLVDQIFMKFCRLRITVYDLMELLSNMCIYIGHWAVGQSSWIWMIWAHLCTLQNRWIRFTIKIGRYIFGMVHQFLGYYVTNFIKYTFSSSQIERKNVWNLEEFVSKINIFYFVWLTINFKCYYSDTFKTCIFKTKHHR